MQDERYKARRCESFRRKFPELDDLITSNDQGEDAGENVVHQTLL